MILFFTSDHCSWCPVLKRMLQEEMKAIGCAVPVYEINIESYPRIAEIFGISIVPTLVYNDTTLSGTPSVTDLRTFLFHSITTDLQVNDQELALFLHTPRKMADKIRALTHEEMLRKISNIEELILDLNGVAKKKEYDSTLKKTIHHSQVQ